MFLVTTVNIMMLLQQNNAWNFLKLFLDLFRLLRLLRKHYLQLLFVCFMFILLSRESDGGGMFSTNPQPLRSCSFLSFPIVSLISVLTTEFAACLKPLSRDNHR